MQLSRPTGSPGGGELHIATPCCPPCPHFYPPHHPMSKATSTCLTMPTLHASTICGVRPVADAICNTPKLTEHTKSTALLPCMMLSICRRSVLFVAVEHILAPKQGKGHAATYATFYMTGHGPGLHDHQRKEGCTHPHAVLSTLPPFLPPTPPHVKSHLHMPNYAHTSCQHHMRSAPSS